MITAAELKRLTTYDDAGLALTLEANGHKNVLFESAKFVGVSNGWEFAYAVTFLRDKQVVKAKVFLRFDPITKRVSANFI